ncbi:hypothetical protein OH76DRAFT_1410700 [Lentinus brumalis]|uniref:Uncharacterized protein n=1 Tax=Lentinus brumalis TaxID=2498619 RepID=A0A371CRL9_9APHY|nr:hypothetical protein OH76DRAFT_1410700 [Polyporus brumalis]
MMTVNVWSEASLWRIHDSLPEHSVAVFDVSIYGDTKVLRALVGAQEATSAHRINDVDEEQIYQPVCSLENCNRESNAIWAVPTSCSRRRVSTFSCKAHGPDLSPELCLRTDALVSFRGYSRGWPPTEIPPLSHDDGFKHPTTHTGAAFA